MIAEQKARQRYGVYCAMPVEDDEDEIPDEELCAAATDQLRQFNRFGNNFRTRSDRGELHQSGGKQRGRFRNDGRCFICNKIGHYRADCLMLKEAVKLKAEEDIKCVSTSSSTSSSTSTCDLCDGPHRFNQCPEVSRCKAELKQALTKRDSKPDSVKEKQANSSRLPMTSRIMAVLEEGPVEGGGENVETEQQAKQEGSFVLMVAKPRQYESATLVEVLGER